ncbi:MAG: 5'/3'-nucleotidase SurE [Nitrospirae bacterium]|nr:5'/3'-nucleotidase SurE [Nitrospirota bacterium]
MKPRVLVTNDDGAEAPGIQLLTRALEEFFDVIVVAPSKEWSTTSHTLTIMKPIEVHEPAPNRFVVEGTPTDCVHLALKQILEPKPDLVISGINRGANMGEDTSYSGTVAAAMEASLCGAKSFAVSCVDWMNPRYEAAAAFAVKFARRLANKKFPPRTFFNVNAPSGTSDEVHRARWTKLGRRVYPLDVRPVAPAAVPSGNSSRFYSIGGVELQFKDLPGTDFHAVRRGFISVTPLHFDLTCHALIPRLKKWDLE